MSGNSDTPIAISTHSLKPTRAPWIKELILELGQENHRISLENVMPAIMEMHKE